MLGVLNCYDNLFFLSFFSLFSFIIFSSEDRLDVKSFGTGTAIKFHGPVPNEPNVYHFKMSCDDMDKDLCKMDQKMYLSM